MKNSNCYLIVIFIIIFYGNFVLIFSCRHVSFLVMRFIRNVSFFGYSEAKPGEPLYEEAYKTAKLLAQKGFVIVNGGGPGVMYASTKGANDVGGETLSVTFDPKDAPGFEGRYLGNVTTKEIKTTNYIERMFRLIEYGDTYIVFKGGTGTLSEFATIWCLARLYYGHHKPFILYGKFWKNIIDVIRKNMVVREEQFKVFKIVNSPLQVLEALEEMETIFSKRLGHISFPKRPIRK